VKQVISFHVRWCQTSIPRYIVGWKNLLFGLKVVFSRILDSLYGMFLHFLTSCRHNSAMITNCQKFTIKWSLYGMSGFHFYCWNQFKVIPVGCTLGTRNQQIFCDVRRGLTVVDNADITQSQVANHHRLLSHMTQGLVECRK